MIDLSVVFHLRPIGSDTDESDPSFVYVLLCFSAAVIAVIAVDARSSPSFPLGWPDSRTPTHNIRIHIHVLGKETDVFGGRKRRKIR